MSQFPPFAHRRDPEWPGLVEAERTADLVRYMEGTRGVANYVGGTFSLFATARSRRPQRLLVSKT